MIKTDYDELYKIVKYALNSIDPLDLYAITGDEDEMMVEFEDLTRRLINKDLTKRFISKTTKQVLDRWFSPSDISKKDIDKIADTILALLQNKDKVQVKKKKVDIEIIEL